MPGPAQAYVKLLAVVRRAHKGELPLKDQNERVRKLVTSGAVEDATEVKPEPPTESPKPPTADADVVKTTS